MGMSYDNPISPLDVICSLSSASRRRNAVNVSIEKDHLVA
jgi:hypothetical protein